MKKVAILLSLIVSINAQIGDVTTFAGSGTAGAVDGMGTAASFNMPPGIVATDKDTLYIADYGNNLIRKISPDGLVTTLATGVIEPAIITLDKDGNLYVSEWTGHRIIKITPAGLVSTFAGSGNEGQADGVGTAASFNKPAGIAFDKDGNLYVSDTVFNLIRKITPEGVVSTFYNGEELGGARGIAFDKDGNLFVANTYKHVISKIDQNGILTTFAGTGEVGYTDGSLSSALFNTPNAIMFLENGDMLVSDRKNHVIRKISNGIVTTFAGKGGVAGLADGIGIRARFSDPYAMTLGKNNEIYLADFYNHAIRKIKAIVTPQVLKVPSEYSTIQAAIDATNESDTVLVADGTYTENFDIDKDIKIISENGAEKTIIDGGKITHVIGFGSSTTRDCVLDGFTVTNGGGDDAGGIFVAEGSPILRNLIITGNRCEKWSGGGIDVIGEGANPLIEDCIITDNYATDSGGGLMVAQKATATINDVTINNNTAGGNGGGISVWGGSIKIKDTILDSNTSAYTLAMFVGTDDAVNFRPIIDIENVTVKNHRDANASNGQLLNFGSCSLSVNNLTLQDINVKGNSILLNNSKGIVSGLTVERDTSQNEIINISNGSKIDFYNLKISQSKTNDGNGLYITGNAVVKIDTLDIKDSYWGCSSGNCYGGTGESISVYNADFTLDNGKFSNIHAEGEGSALRADDGSRVEISNTLVDSSYSEGAGGGMVFYQSDYVSIKNSSFIANRSVNGGGGIHVNEVDSLFLYNSTFIADSSQGGGAVELGGGKYYHLDGNVMENNYSADGAGAINLWGNDKVEIFNSKFISNKSVNDGGAIYSWNTDSLFIDNSTFNGNESTDGNGGAMTFKGDANSTLYCEIKNTTFENNSGGWGGAIAAFEPIDMNIDSVFATGNEASGNGGFIELCCGASVSITNSTIYNNETNNNDLSVPSGCKMTIKNSIIWKDKIGVDTDATIEVTYSDVEGGFTGTGNINANPIFCDTINYLIQDASPCVGAGENGSNMGARGIGCYRPSSFDWVSTALDTVNITQSNLADTYTLQWSESTDADGDSIIYLLYARTGVNPAEQVYDTTSTSLLIPYQEFLQKTFEQIPMLSRATVKFSVGATDGFDTVMVMGDDRVVFVNRYEYLSTEGKGIPTEFALHENYPNPFNPTTTLRFDLPDISDVTLTIYNMLGQRVKTFNMNDTPAGFHSIKWNATNDYGDPVGAGVYLYQLRANQYVKTRKMVLLK